MSLSNVRLSVLIVVGNREILWNCVVGFSTCFFQVLMQMFIMLLKKNWCQCHAKLFVPSTSICSLRWLNLKIFLVCWVSWNFNSCILIWRWGYLYHPLSYWSSLQHLLLMLVGPTKKGNLFLVKRQNGWRYHWKKGGNECKSRL